MLLRKIIHFKYFVIHKIIIPTKYGSFGRWHNEGNDMTNYMMKWNKMKWNEWGFSSADTLSQA